MSLQETRPSGQSPDQTPIRANPNVKIHPDLRTDSRDWFAGLYMPMAPYSVSVDQEAIGNLHRSLGFSDSEIPGINIDIEREGFTTLGNGVAGSYNPLTKRTSIYTDWIFNKYKRSMEIASKMATNNEKPGPFRIRDARRMQQFLYTKRLPEYLRHAPPERGREFAKKLLLNAHNRRLSAVILHEEQHRSDYKNLEPRVLVSIVEKLGTAGIATIAAIILAKNLREPTPVPKLNALVRGVGLIYGVLRAISIQYKLDPLERTANKFAKKHKSNPAYRSMITISPKVEPDS